MRALLPLLVLVLGGCASAAVEDANAPRIVRIGDDFSLAVGERVQLAQAPFTVQFDRVFEDSRCPMDARCVWEGNAKIAVRVEAAKTLEKEFVEVIATHMVLHTSERFSRRRQYGGHDVVLVHLAPTPMSGQTVKDYVATLRVEARQ